MKEVPIDEEKNNQMKCMNCEILSTRFKAFLSYFLPMVYGITLFSVAWLKVSSPIFVAICLAFGSIDVITSIVGMIGILCPSGLAIRSTIPLLAMENLVTFLISIGLLVESILYKEYSNDFMILDFSVGLTISFTLMISTILSVLFIWKISDYLNDIDASNIFEELASKHTKPSKHIVNKVSSNFDSKLLLNKSNNKISSKDKNNKNNEDHNEHIAIDIKE